MNLNNQYQKIIIRFFIVILITSLMIPLVQGQEVGQWGIQLVGACSKPVGGLSAWFKPAPDLSLSLGQQYNDRWFIDAVVEASRFNQENVTGYPAGKLDLSLNHIGVMVGGHLDITQIWIIRPFFEIAMGIFHWQGRRGAIKADSTVIPYVPPIVEKTLKDTNWGFKSGIGLAFMVTSSMALDLSASYRFIVGDLWPTMQPHIELEGVSGFQTLNLSAGIRYFF